MLIEFKGEKLDTDDLKFLGSGTEGKVYAHNEYALKVYHDKIRKTIFLNESMVRKLFDIETNRILLPRDFVFKINETSNLYFGGYATELLDNEYDVKDIVDMSSDFVSYEFDLLEENKQTLNKNKLLYNDTSEMGNFIFDNGFYFVDPGSILPSYLSDESTDKLNDKYIGEGVYKNIIYLQGNKEALAKEMAIIISTNIDTHNEIMTVIEEIYQDDFKANKEKYFRYIRQQLEHYGSLQKYKYELIKNNFQNYEYKHPDAVAKLKKVL